MKRLLVFLLILCMILQAAVFTVTSSADSGILVFVNETMLTMDVPPVVISERTMIPIRAISQAIGASSINWSEQTRRVTVEYAGRVIILQEGSAFALVNRKIVPIDAAPVAINGRIMVPLRFIAENMGVLVNWDRTARTVRITHSDRITPDNYVVRSELSTFRNSFSTVGFAQFTIDGGHVKADGLTDDESEWLWLRISDNATGQNRDVFGQVNQNNSFKISLSENLPAGKYEISIFSSRNRYGTYNSKVWDIPLVSTGNIIFFPPSLILKDNLLMYEKEFERSNLERFTRVNVFNEREANALRSLAGEITKGLTDDYDKVLAINRWVSENIYYDWDSFRRGVSPGTRAFATFESRRSVCAGYANLTDALLRFVGIPSRIVTGLARGYSTTGRDWDEMDLSDSNHAWNKAFVDGRWIMFDTTWNSANRFENGVFISKPPDLTYFDMTIEFLSLRHKMMRLSH